MSQKSKKSSWGLGIAVVYGAFMLALIGVVIASRFQKVDLVAKDYYDQEVRYQSQIDKIRRTQLAGYSPRIDHAPATEMIVVKFPDSSLTGPIEGALTLFRPSNAGMDRRFVLAPDEDGTQKFDCGRLVRGLWKVKIDWKVDTLAYYHEEELYVE